MHNFVQYDASRAVANDIVAIKPTWQGTQYTSVPATLSATETPIFLVSSTGSMAKSQLSVYLTAASGNNATFYYYYSPDGGTTWIPVCLYNTSTGELTQRIVLLDSGSYTYSSTYEGLDNIPVAAASLLLVTAKSATSSQAYTCQVIVRDN